MGAYLSGAGAAQRSALRQYGLAIGTAYQIYEDCLDLFGTEAPVGKSLGTDLTKRKVTLPLLIAMEQSTPPSRASLEMMVRDWTPGHFASLLKILHGHRALEGSQAEVHQYLEVAREKLNLLPETKLTDRARAVASVGRILREHPEIETVLVGDGWPIFHDGQRALAALCDR